VQEQITTTEKEIKSKKMIPGKVINGILHQTKILQEKVGYKTYQNWIKSKTPIRLEDMLNK